MKRMQKELHEQINAQIVSFNDNSRTHVLMSEYSDHVLECKKFCDVPAIGDCYVLQGGGTDGKYLYLAKVTYAVNGKQDGHIVKIDPDSGEVLQIGPRVAIDHANDITYNEKIDKLLVVHNAPHYNWVSVIDPVTLDVTEVKQLDRPIFCMAYNAKRDCYIVGKSGGQHFAMLDSEFKTIREYTAVHTRYTTQGMECDDDYIYFVQHGRHCVMQYDWDGNFIEYLPLDLISHEPENLCFIKGKLYISFNRFFKGENCRTRVYIAEKKESNLKPVDKTTYGQISAEILALDGDKVATEEKMMKYSYRKGTCKFLYNVGPFDDKKYKILQGGGTDGKYLYLAFVTSKKDGHQNGIIVKVDPKTGEVLKRSECLEIDHANDIAYNPRTNKLYVVHNVPNNDTLTALDPETLEFIETVKIPVRIFAMDYNYSIDRYVVGRSGGQNYTTLDPEFNIRHEYEAINTKYTTQGVTSDDDFVYFIQFKNSCIMKYDWKGNFHEYIPLDERTNEPENLCFIDGKLYACFNTFKDGHLGAPAVYEVKIK